MLARGHLLADLLLHGGHVHLRLPQQRGQPRYLPPARALLGCQPLIGSENILVFQPGGNLLYMGQCEDDIKIPFPVVHSILIRRECISCIF